MNLFDLMAVIRLDSSEYEKGLEDASKKQQTFGQKLKTGLGTAGKVAAGAITAVTVATGAVAGAMVKGAGEVAAYGDNIDKMSQKMGLSAEAYQEWDAIMRHSGTSIDTMQAGMKTLANAVENGNEAFERLGLTQEEIAGMSQEDLFGATITALQNVENETERTYLAGQLLGRGATELGALLNTSAEDTEAMRQRVHELGGVMSDEAVKAAAAYQDSLQDMTTAFDGLKRGLMGEFMPAITTVMDGLTEIFAGDSDKGIGLVTQGIDNLVSNISEKIPEVMRVGAQIVTSLLTAITKNLPTLITAGSKAVLEIATGIIKQLPQIVKSGLEVIQSLADGLSNSLPELIPTVVDVMLEIVDTLIDNIDLVVDAALKIIVALGEGLIKAIPRLVAKVPEIIVKLVGALIENVPKIVETGITLVVELAKGLVEGIPEMVKRIPEIITAIVNGLTSGISSIVQVGKDLISGLWNGISEKAEWLKDKAGGVVNGIKGIFTGKQGFDEKSPSKWAQQVFEYVMEGGARGLDEGLSNVLRTADKAVDRVKDSLTVDADMSGASDGAEKAENRLIERPIYITVQSILDGKIIGENTAKYMRNSERAYGGAY